MGTEVSATNVKVRAIRCGRDIKGHFQTQPFKRLPYVGTNKSNMMVMPRRVPTKKATSKEAAF
jgi:hypothetical protein